LGVGVDRATGRRRRQFRRLVLLVLLTLLVTSASVPPETAFDLQLAPFVAGKRFNWIDWETSAVSGEVAWRLQELTTPDHQQLHSSLLGGKGEVLAYLDRQRQIGELENRVRTEVAQLPQPGPVAPFEGSPILQPMVESLESELESLKGEQQAAATQVERIMASQVSQVLAEEGLGRVSVKGLSADSSTVLPPVAFRFSDLPTYLVVSPRDEIRIYRGIFLLPDIPDSQRTRIESAIEARLDVSALVVDVGGIGSWPTMVINDASLPSRLDIVAHEWAHTYLFFQPLGMHYDDNRDLTTMNETVASIVGGEVADLVIKRYYPELLPPPPPVDDGPVQENLAPYADFNQAMRRIRVHVDELLSQGRVSDAEAYMEAERQELVAAGYNLRRLNQAYFAFYGSYATSPASVDPIGPWMRQLRARSGSLKAFLDKVARMRRLDDLLRAVDAGGS
jgi:hypothetical protein